MDPTREKTTKCTILTARVLGSGSTESLILKARCEKFAVGLGTALSLFTPNLALSPVIHLSVVLSRGSIFVEPTHLTTYPVDKVKNHNLAT